MPLRKVDEASRENLSLVVIGWVLRDKKSWMLLSSSQLIGAKDVSMEGLAITESLRPSGLSN